MDDIKTPVKKDKAPLSGVSREAIYKSKDSFFAGLDSIKHPRRSKAFGSIKNWMHKASRSKTVKKIEALDKKHRLPFRLATSAVALLMLTTFVVEVTQPKTTFDKYDLTSLEGKFLSEPSEAYADKLVVDNKTGAITFNKDYTPAQDVEGSSNVPKVIATFNSAPSNKVEIQDPINQVNMTFNPKFGVDAPKKDKNRVVYPIKNLNASAVYTLRGSGVKEDIILHDFQGDKKSFKYELGLSEGTEARIERDGSLGVYGVDKMLLGNVTAGTDKDAELLKKARQNGEKKTLLFRIPAPVILEANKNKSKATASYSLEGNMLEIKAIGLDRANYPITIDPSVYVETASKLMRGNNETNTDFDIDDELIQKSQTTGARIDAWEDNLDMSEGTWDHGVAAAGGYLYRVGGRVDPSKPTIVGQQRTLETGASTFTLDMPSTRPAGDLYMAMMCHDGSDGGSITNDSSWTKVYDAQGYAVFYKVGTDQGGGNEASSYNFGGYGTEEWAGVIVRIKGFDSSDPISGTPGTNSSSSNSIPTYPATTPDNNNTLVVRSTGFDTDNPSDTGWVPSGHTKIDSSSSSSGGSGSCGFTAASLDSSPASGVSTGTASHADASVNDDWGASSIAINPTPVTAGTSAKVNWAQFNSTSLALESPNPGAGACSGWCTNSVYDLPEARRALSVVAYNGYLYAIGGTDGTNRESTVYIAKLGANGEPQLWHPSGGTPAYWYSDSGLNGGTARSYLTAVAYNNRMYVLGGQTNGSTGGVTTVEYADIKPNGTLGSWSSGTSLPSARFGHSTQIYNDTIYLIGGNNSGTLQNSVYYSKINSDGSLNSWISTTSFSTARASMGGTFTTIWGAYVYLSGGCTAVNGSGYCTSVASDTQVGSINADGSISSWTAIPNLSNQRMGYNIIGWQNGLYRIGGCVQQNTGTGTCTSTLADVDYGVINPAGEVSTVSISEASGSGNCTGGSPYNCDLPPPGDDAGEGGQMLSMTTILNGYFYVIGGCIDYDCNGTDPAGDDSNVTGNISYTSIDSSGNLTEPSACSGTSYGAWCVDSTNRVNGTTGVAAAGVTTFNDRIYIVGGLTGSSMSTNIYYNTTNSDGSFTGAWSSVDMTTAGISEDVAYTYAYARANPASAGSNPGNLYVFGGCGNASSGAGCGGSDYETEVYKCNITTTGNVSGCSTSGQQQIDSTPGSGGTDGLGIHSGTVYANYIYLVGGYSQAESDKDDVIYAKFNNSNNVVAVTGSDWIESPNKLSVGRRRGFSFGYNGHIYSVGGYDDSGTGIIPFIEWSKMNVSDGSTDSFITSSVTINQRWGLSMAVSNSYAYVVGGCDVGASPGSCSSFEPSVQTFQLYNNDSGAVNDFTAQSDQTYTADTDRWGASSTIYNGYIYTAGGCISATDCTNATNSVQYAPISANDGKIGTWAAGGNLPADRAWGSLQVAGGTLYYIGGQDDTATNEQSTVYYTSSIASGNPTWNGTAASNGLPAARTKFGAAVWNDRLYVVGGLDGSATTSSTVYVSPQQDSGGNISSAWSSSTAFNVARTGAAVTAYANNLYLFGGYDGSNYLSDVQFTQINTDGTVDSWTYTTNLPGVLRDAQAVSANGYIYLVGGRTAAATCAPNTLITPISANTTIASGNNPTGVGEWYETNVRYTGDRYGAAVAYDKGKIYTMGGGCTSPLSSNRHYESTVKSQPQVAIYSRMIDTDTDVFPTYWLMNGLDNSIGARWTLRYRSMHDLDTITSPSEDCGTTSSMSQMSTWGYETNFGDVDLGTPETYIPRNGASTSAGTITQSGNTVTGSGTSFSSDLVGGILTYKDGTQTTITAYNSSTSLTVSDSRTIGSAETYSAGGGDINCARYFYFYVNIDASKTFGYPEDVNRGPTISDLSLFFTSDPSKRLHHGKTFTGGEKQPLDTPF